MARRKRLSEGKQNIIQSLISEYDIKTADDIQNALKDLLGGTIESMLESELDEHLGYEPYERSEEENARNGYKKKTLVSKHGKIEIAVPQDRDSSFSPKVVKKRQKDISAIEEKIITMYAKGLSTKQISEQIEDIYGFEVSESLVSNITDKILVEVEEWQQRPLEELYSVVYIDAIHFSVREDGKISKIAAYIILALNEFGLKEVLGIYVGENESSKYWLGILNELKSRGVKEIWVLCSDGLTGIKEAISVAFPKTEH